MALLVADGVQAGIDRPSRYSEFDTSLAAYADARVTEVARGAALKALVEGRKKKFIYVPIGWYRIDNPIVIDRDTTLYLHGQDEMRTLLVPLHEDQPLFQIDAAPLVNLAQFHIVMHPGREPIALHARSIAIQNLVPMTVELMDLFADGTVDFGGPGTFTWLNGAARTLGAGEAPVIIDHPQAEVRLFGIDMSEGPTPLRPGITEYAHVWQKRGRIRIYGTTFEGNIGKADVRIDTRSDLGPHIVAGTRSEGCNGAYANRGCISRLLYVPPSTERVDVVVKNVTGGFQTGPWWHQGTGTVAERWDRQNNCELASYSAAGTLWMIGNQSTGACTRVIVSGQAPNATIVSVGNQVGGPDAFPGTYGRLITALDSYSRFWFTGFDCGAGPQANCPGARHVGDASHYANCEANPTVRWIKHPHPPTGVSTPSPAQPRIGSTDPPECGAYEYQNPPKLSQYANVPAVPADVVPDAPPKPAMDVRLPGFVSVKDSPFHAVGDGIADDTQAIQAALEAQCAASGYSPPHVWFPPGTYRITETLFHNVPKLGPRVAGWGCGTDGLHNSGYGGWIAGAGPEQSQIVMDPALKKTVLRTSNAFSVMQGLALKTFSYRPGDPMDQYAYQIDMLNSIPQESTWYDMVFEGGYGAYATGTMHGSQCNTLWVVRSKLRNARIGYISGHQNAIANYCWNCLFENNDFPMGAHTTDWYCPTGVCPGQGGPGAAGIRATPCGGNWSLLNSESRGTRIAELGICGGFGGSAQWYYNGYHTDAPQWWLGGNHSGGVPLLLENVQHTPSPGANTYWICTAAGLPFEWCTGPGQTNHTGDADLPATFYLRSGMGPILLHSSFQNADRIRVGLGGMTVGYGISLHSEVPDWTEVIRPANQSGAKDRMP